MPSFNFTGKVCRFPGNSGWYFVRVPEKNMLTLPKKKGAWGFVSALFVVEKYGWKSSLLPMGKGQGYFVALPKKMRQDCSVALGDNISIAVSYGDTN